MLLYFSERECIWNINYFGLPQVERIIFNDMFNKICYPFFSSGIYYPGLFWEIWILWSQDFPMVKIDLHYVWIIFFEERVKVKMHIPKKMGLPESIWGLHLRRLTSLTHSGSIFFYYNSAC